MSNHLHQHSLDIASLIEGYCSKRFTPVDVLREVYRRISGTPREQVWTYLVPERESLAQAENLAGRDPASLPLFGIPFSVKDNIHVAGMPTTASCPAFSHVPEETASVVEKILDAGAILVGKNTMDQFATGLVGVRGPHHPVNPFNPEYISGGSSSGSAVAVSTGLVSFSLGSDTGGSGRIPAALNNVVGLKPTPGIVSTHGMIYANRSFDCVPIFALSCRDAKLVFDQAMGPDSRDPFLRRFSGAMKPKQISLQALKVGIPDAKNLTFFGDVLAQAAYQNAIDRIKGLGAAVVEVDYEPFIEAGHMLFEGPLLAERLDSLMPFIDNHADDVHEVIKGIVEKARSYSATDLYKEIHRIAELRVSASAVFDGIDLMMLPTAGTIYKIDEVKADPVQLNATMGYYSYFVNILQLSAIAVPAAIRPDGLPFGVCFVADSFQDELLAELGSVWQRSTQLPLGHAGYMTAEEGH